MTLTYRQFLNNGHNLNESWFHRSKKQNEEPKISLIGKYIDDMISASKIDENSKIFFVATDDTGRIYDEHNERLPVNKVEVNNNAVRMTTAVDRKTNDIYAYKISDLSSSMTIKDFRQQIIKELHIEDSDSFSFQTISSFVASLDPLRESYSYIKSNYSRSSLCNAIFSAFQHSKISDPKNVAIVDAFLGKAPYDELEDDVDADDEDDDIDVPDDDDGDGGSGGDGKDGKNGEDGKDSKNGENGKDGKDGDRRLAAEASSVKGAVCAITGSSNVTINYNNGKQTEKADGKKVIHVIKDITRDIPGFEKYDNETRTANDIENSRDPQDRAIVDIYKTIVVAHGPKSVDIIARKSKPRSSGSSGTTSRRQSKETAKTENTEASSEIKESYNSDLQYYYMIDEALQQIDETESSTNDLYLVVSIGSEKEPRKEIGKHQLTPFTQRSEKKEKEIETRDIDIHQPRKNNGKNGKKDSSSGKQQNKNNKHSKKEDDGELELPEPTPGKIESMPDPDDL